MKDSNHPPDPNSHELDALRYGVASRILGPRTLANQVAWERMMQRPISIHNIRLPKKPPPLTPITADYQILDPEKLEPKALPKPKGDPC